uniref:Uncharacterized protein n=1 Tax=Utricularia reniformis TaxID=192314 RepID=A0A1Y0AYS0_9LAMI|nr:hypothetical protein AEK19_MT0727 [Utricularia reniformis]ART30306.1 hypothetical protein AEK19_MT0727 [Utricularia reniformis]
MPLSLLHSIHPSIHLCPAKPVHNKMLDQGFCNLTSHPIRFCITYVIVGILLSLLFLTGSFECYYFLPLTVTFS